MGYDFTGGRIFDFCIDFSMGLTTVQRDCAACDEIYMQTTDYSLTTIPGDKKLYCHLLHFTYLFQFG